MSLTHGAVTTLVRTKNPNPAYQPIVQVINVKPVGANNPPDRFRVVLSDGDHYAQGMLATQLNRLVLDGMVRENALLKVEDFMANDVSGRVVIIVLKLSVVNSGEGMGRIGDPQDVGKAGYGRPAPAAAAAPMYNRTNVPASTAASNPYVGASRPAAVASKPSPRSNPYNTPPTNRYGGSAPIERNATAPSGAYTQIANLNMYQNRFTLRARVTNKSDVRTWSNAKGEGSLFSIELLDSSGVDIRATFFKEAVDKFYEMLQVNKVYTFSGGRLKVANRQWNTCKSSYEITMDTNSEIHLVDDTGDIAQQNFSFVKVAELEQMQEGSLVDILVIVKSVGEVANLVSKKTGRDVTKCDLVVGDDSGTDITLTTWGQQATQAPETFAASATEDLIVAFRRCRVSDFGGKSLSTSMGAAVVVRPQIPEASRLETWWRQSGGMQQPARSLSNTSGGSSRMPPLADRKTIEQITLENMGTGEKADYVAIQGTITFIKKDKEGGAWYPACPNTAEPCKQRFKVTQTTDQRWYCDKCHGSYDNCVRRFIFSGTVADTSSTTWVSFFDDQARVLMDNVTADEVYEKTDGSNNTDLYDGYFAKAVNTEWIFKIKVKNEMVGEETRVKKSVMNMFPLDYVKESREMLDALKSW